MSGKYVLFKSGVVSYIATFDTPQKGDWVPVDQVPDAALLAHYQQEMASQFETACQLMIAAGFSSSALGAAYIYPTDDASQRNLVSAAMSAAIANSTWTRPFWCADSSGVWEMRSHTAAQMQQVNSDFDNFIAAAQTKLATLKASLAAAMTSTQAEAIVWN